MEILPFNYKKNEVRVITDPDGNIWFVAKDIATLLNYKRTADAVKQHCKSSISFSSIEWVGKTPTLDPQTKLIPESDVWRLIIRSRLPEAEKIEKWIMEEVLPSIRKTGSYSLTEQPKEKSRDDLISVSDSELDRELKALKFILDNYNLSEKEKIEISNKIFQKINFETLENPHLRKQEQVFTLTQLLKEFGIDMRTADFNRKLESFGIIERFGNGWILLDMKFGENRNFKEGKNHCYYRSTFEELLDLVL